MRREILARRSTAAKLALMAAGLALATGIRWLLDRGQAGVPMLTFYPVLLLSALFLGGRYAVISAVASLAIIRGLFGPIVRLPDTPTGAAILLLYAVTVTIIVLTGHLVRQLLLENHAQLQRAETFNTELQHRAKNVQQILRALAGHGPLEGEDRATFVDKLLGRLEALTRANRLLHFGALETAALDELVEAAVAPFGPARFSCTGTPCAVHKSAATPVAMALHELATNALKYGALSAPEGSVAITWHLAGPGRICLEWTERGGPPVAAPTRRGFGARLLRPQAGLEQVEQSWLPQGLACRMELVGRAMDPATPE